MSCSPNKLLYLFERITLFAFLLLFVSTAQAQTQTLAFNQPIEKTIKLKEKHTYKLNLEANQFAQIVVDKKGVNVILSLHDSGGNFISESEGEEDPKGQETLIYGTETAQSFSLEVRTNDEESNGNYVIKLAVLRELTNADRALLEGERLLQEGNARNNTGNPDRHSISQAKYLSAAEKFLSINEKGKAAIAFNLTGRTVSNKAKMFTQPKKTLRGIDGEEPQKIILKEKNEPEEENRFSITRLPFSRREANAILAIVPPDESFAALDFNANRTNATSSLLSKFRIVHFATHGWLDSRRPELSGIVLSLVNEKGQQQEGVLRLHEIYSLELNADLVALSACQTALGKEIRGEGLIGLTRGFMCAGAARVSASLWKVDDAATAELMSRFYHYMLKEKMTPPAALRSAQLELSKQKRWNAPYYWASFVLQGEWR